MNGFQILTEESYQLLKHLRRKKAITDEEYRKIEDCVTIEELLAEFEKIVKLPMTMNKGGTFFFYLLCNVFFWDIEERHKSTYLTEKQLVFINECLMKNEGLITRDDALKILHTQEIDKQVITPLFQGRRIPLVIKMKTRKKYGNYCFYFFNPIHFNIAFNKKSTRV